MNFLLLFKSFILKITIIALIIKVFKKFSIFRIIWSFFNLILFSIFGISLIDIYEEAALWPSWYISLGFIFLIFSIVFVVEMQYLIKKYTTTIISMADNYPAGCINPLSATDKAGHPASFWLLEALQWRGWDQSA